MWGLVIAWLVGSCRYVEFLFRADAFFLGFRRGAIRLYFSRVAFWLGVLFFVCWGIALFGNKFLIIQKKKKEKTTNGQHLP